MEKTLIILSGRGKLPLIFKQLAEEKGYKAYTVGVKTITDFKTDFKIPFLGFTEFEELLKDFPNAQIVMLGKFNPNLPVALFDSFLNRLRLKIFGGNYKRNWEIFLGLRRRLNTVLPGEVIKIFIEYLEGKGFSFFPSEEIKRIAKPLLVEEGILTGRVDKQTLIEGKKFLKYAKRLADMEIGQTLVFKRGQIYAVETVEGTDKTIERGAKLAGKGFSVAKAARTNQDYRIDVPAVGLETLKIVKKFGGKSIFLEAQNVFIVEKEKFLKEAERSGIAVIGLTPR